MLLIAGIHEYTLIALSLIIGCPSYLQCKTYMYVIFNINLVVVQDNWLRASP